MASDPAPTLEPITAPGEREYDGTVVHLASEYWPYARTGGLAEAVRGFKKKDLVALYGEALVGGERRRLVVRAVGTRDRELLAKRAAGEDEILIRDPSAFKQDKRYFDWLRTRPS